MTHFTHAGPGGKRRAAFAAPYPGKIIPVAMAEIGGRLTCQKDSFLCGARGIDLDIAFQRKLGVGFFGGEGFILQKLEGDGLAFVHAGGTVIRKDLAGETLRVDTFSVELAELVARVQARVVETVEGEELAAALNRFPARLLRMLKLL